MQDGRYVISASKRNTCIRRPKIKARREERHKVPAAKTQNKSKREKNELDTSAQRKTEKLSEVIKKKRSGGMAMRRDSGGNEEIRILGHSW